MTDLPALGKIDTMACAISQCTKARHQSCGTIP